MGSSYFVPDLYAVSLLNVTRPPGVRVLLNLLSLYCQSRGQRTHKKTCNYREQHGRRALVYIVIDWAIT